eukprot:1362096-Prymnesium_polylepis.2
MWPHSREPSTNGPLVTLSLAPQERRMAAERTRARWHAQLHTRLRVCCDSRPSLTSVGCTPEAFFCVQQQRGV